MPGVGGTPADRHGHVRGQGGGAVSDDPTPYPALGFGSIVRLMRGVLGLMCVKHRQLTQGDWLLVRLSMSQQELTNALGEPDIVERNRFIYLNGIDSGNWEATER